MQMQCKPCPATRAPRVSSKRVVMVRADAGAGTSSAPQPRKTTIHKLIEQQGCLLLPGCYDALSAKCVQKTGHEAAFVSGYAVSATVLGEPDLGILTPPEMARKAGQIVGAVPRLPIIVDADSGGGNILNVQRTIRQLIAVGAKGCFLEDQAWPKRMGNLRNKEIVDMGEFAAKIWAAREAIGNADFFLVARTDARGTSAKHGLEEAIKRANLYADCGADCTYVEAPRSAEELAIIAKETKGLRATNMMEGGVAPLHSKQELQAMGFHMLAHPVAGLYAATKALLNVYGTLADKGTTRENLDTLAHYSEVNELVGLELRLAAEQRLTAPRDSASKTKIKVKAPVKAIDLEQ